MREVLGALHTSSLAGVMLFCSSRYSLNHIAEELARQRQDLPIIGCTSAGEITPFGPVSGTITAVGFPASDFALQAIGFQNLDNFDPNAAQRAVVALVADAAAKSVGLGHHLDRAALLLVDGLSRREELLANSLQHILEDIPLIGGSSGDDLAFRTTYLFHEGAFQSDRAILAILSAKHPLKVFRSHHHVPDRALAVVTRADAAARKVYELNGERAAAEYARLIGMNEADLSQLAFADHPLMVRVGGQYFSRSIQRIDDGGGLVFESAIDRGLVLRPGRSTDSIGELIKSLDECNDQRAGFDAVLVFESAFNRIEAHNAGLSAKFSDIYREHRFVGFNTYGEQFRDFHVNRNMVGLAIGRGLLC